MHCSQAAAAQRRLFVHEAERTVDALLAQPCFEEMLRYTSPVHGFCGTANVDPQVSGIRIPESSKMLCGLGAYGL